jgi:type III pantothenate kinase
MLIAVDIGNTHTVFGIFQGNDLLFQFRLNTDSRRTEDEYIACIFPIFARYLCSISDIKACAISCVVPNALSALIKVMSNHLNVKCHVISATNHNLQIKIDYPELLGTDLIANSLAAWKLYNKSCLIVDFGTATTLMLTEIGDDNKSFARFLGGSIAPGIKCFTEYLGTHTAQLPRVQGSKALVARGTNTKDAMTSGIYFGYIGLVQNIITQLKVEYGKPLCIIATGGISSAEIFAQTDWGFDHINPDLTLIGIKEFYRSCHEGLN